jgi:hypothetical protein
MHTCQYSHSHDHTHTHTLPPQFAPSHHGIKLATCSIDGRIRIYEATDLMNLSLWSLPEQFEGVWMCV